MNLTSDSQQLIRNASEMVPRLQIREMKIKGYHPVES